MSKENVVLFSRAVNTKPEIDERVSGTAVLQEWIEIAEYAGFEFTAAEFCAVLKQLTNGDITPENGVREYLSLRQTIGGSALTRRMEQTFIGGVPRAYNPRALLNRGTEHNE